MTQTERFLRFIRKTAGRDVGEPSVLFRLEQDELVITYRWRTNGATLLAASTSVASVSGLPGAQ